MYKNYEMKSREYFYGPGSEFKNLEEAMKMAEYKKEAMLSELGRMTQTEPARIDNNGHRVQVIIPVKYEI